MQDVIARLGQALLVAAGMAWQTGWTLVLGFTISALLQSVVSTEQMKRVFGRSGPKESRWPRLPARPRRLAPMLRPRSCGRCSGRALR
jgi:hypothetical protein